MIITIDGPSGSGKSTISAKLAKTLGFLHVNQGAFFRSVALRSLEENIAASDEAALVARAGQMRFTCDESGALLVDDKPYGSRERSQEVSIQASELAIHPKLRELLLDAQRVLIEHAAKRGVVVEGRDAGSVAFPKAELKLFLDAKAEVRAERRFAEIEGEASPELSESELAERELRAAKLLEEIKERDERDSSRSISPLVCPADAVVIDTSGLSAEKVLESCLAFVEGCRKDS